MIGATMGCIETARANEGIVTLFILESFGCIRD